MQIGPPHGQIIEPAKPKRIRPRKKKESEGGSKVKVKVVAPNVDAALKILSSVGRKPLGEKFR